MEHAYDGLRYKRVLQEGDSLTTWSGEWPLIITTCPPNQTENLRGYTGDVKEEGGNGTEQARGRPKWQLYPEPGI